MSILNLLKKEKKFEIDSNKKYFRTSSAGGIYVDVEGIINSNIPKFECYSNNWYLSNFIINDKYDLCMGETVIYISKFGIVNNIKMISKGEENKNSPVTILQFEDCRRFNFIFDSMQDNYRLDKIGKSNLLCYNYLM